MASLGFIVGAARTALPGRLECIRSVLLVAKV